jgi:hydrogenase/urease accessory protein HupE
MPSAFRARQATAKPLPNVGAGPGLLASVLAEGIQHAADQRLEHQSLVALQSQTTAQTGHAHGES